MPTPTPMLMLMPMLMLTPMLTQTLTPMRIATTTEEYL
jgi:hypothetical protein